MKAFALIVAVILFIGINLISFLVTAGITYLICFCFSLAFSWKIALGIWVILLLINLFIGDHKKSK